DRARVPPLRSERVHGRVLAVVGRYGAGRSGRNPHERTLETRDRETMISRAGIFTAILAAGTLLAGCDDDSPTGPTGPISNCDPGVLCENITQNRTLYADTVYTISGFIQVTNGAQLTIQAGTR